MRLNFSWLTKADLDAVLKLKEDYDNLQKDVEQLRMFILDFEQVGVVRRNIKSSNFNVTACYNVLYDAIKEGRYKPNMIQPEWRDNFGMYERVSAHPNEDVNGGSK
jgi:hypothetical protein